MSQQAIERDKDQVHTTTTTTESLAQDATQNTTLNFTTTSQPQIADSKIPGADRADSKTPAIDKAEKIPALEKPEKASTTENLQEQVDILEIYVEKSRAIGLGQRLLWHLEKFNKPMNLPLIHDVKDFYMQPVSATSRLLPSATPMTESPSYPGTRVHQQYSRIKERKLMYTQDSNTVFYYNDYRVVLLLDFSQSSTSIYPSMSKSYLEKMRDCLSVITENLLFQIQNQFMSATRHHQQDSNGANNRRSADIGNFKAEKFKLDLNSMSDDSQEFSDAMRERYPFQYSTIEELQYESGTTALPSRVRCSSLDNNLLGSGPDSPRLNFSKTGPAKHPLFNAKDLGSQNNLSKLEEEKADSLSGASEQQRKPPSSRNRSSEKHQENPTVKDQPANGASKAKGSGPEKAANGANNYYQQHKQKSHMKSSYSPRVYLSIIVSGIPPGNHIKIIMHNQKIDVHNLKDLLANIEGQLVHIEQNMKNNIKLTADDVLKNQPVADIQGSLQAHLKNAQYILDLMNLNAKPLLVFFTDCTNSLFELHQRMANHKQQASKVSQGDASPFPASAQAKQRKYDGTLQNLNWQHTGHLDASIHQLHLNDAQLISIDLAEENKVCQQFGFINHENELAYLTSITQGVHLTYSKLMEIKFKLDKLRGVPSYVRRGETLLSKNFFEREKNFQFEILNGSLSVIDYGKAVSAACRLESPRRNSFAKNGHPFVSKRHRNDQIVLRQINPLQKLMFSRASNYKSFMRSAEIRGLLGEDFIQNQFLFKGDLQTRKAAGSWTDLSVSSLLLQNQVVPILTREGLAEYMIRDVGFFHLIEFRSKMGFKFSRVEYYFDTSVATSKDPAGTMLMPDKTESQQRLIKSIEYLYWVGANIYITCVLSLEPIPGSSNSQAIKTTFGGKEGTKKSKSAQEQHKAQNAKPSTKSDVIYVSFDLHVPAENLRQINREKAHFQKQMQLLDQMKFAKKSELSDAKKDKAKESLYGRLHSFINQIYERDRHFSLLEKLLKVLCHSYPLLIANNEEASNEHQNASGRSKLGDPSQYQVKHSNAPESLRPSQFKEENYDGRKKSGHLGKEIPPEQIISSQAEAVKEDLKSSKKADKSSRRQNKQKLDKEGRKNTSVRRTAVKNTKEDARRFLLEKKNRKLWEKLSKQIASNAQIYQWKCYFRYYMLTIMTQSNRASYRYDAFTSQTSERKWRHRVDLEKIWVQDRQIERKLFEDLREFTTFTLNRDTFIQVFVETQTANQYRFNGGNCQLGPHHHHQGVHGCEHNHQDFGFCLIKLKWIASNIAECHLGFYSVGPRSRLKFIKKMQAYMNQQYQTPVDEKMRPWMNTQAPIDAGDERKGAPFFCYSKNIPSLLMRLPQRQLKKQKQLENFFLDNAFSDSDSENARNSVQARSKQIVKNKRARRQHEQQVKAEQQLNQLYYHKKADEGSHEKIPFKMLLFTGAEPIPRDLVHTSLHELWKVRFGFGKKGLQPNRTQVFHQYEWRWENLNEKTNMEFFNRVLSMRLQDGFIIINRYTGTSDYFHLVKVLKAYKDHTSKLKSYKPSGKTSEQPDAQKNEKVEIVVQYIIEHFTECVKEEEDCDGGDSKQVSVVKAQLLMEKEVSFFQIDRGEKIPSMNYKLGGTGSSTLSFILNRAVPTSRMRGATSRASSISKSRPGSHSRESIVSRGSGQQEPGAGGGAAVGGGHSSDGTQECRSGKVFFHLLRDYIQEVDQMLRQSTCTYHHVVKNSIKKQVNKHELVLRDQDSHALQEQLCYFKNIQASTKRQRKQLEDSIREKMSILHADWSSFLQQQYPELFNEQDKLAELGLKRPVLLKAQNPGIPLTQQQDAHDDQSMKIELLMQNSKRFAEQNLRAPLLERHSDPSLQQELQSTVNQRFLTQMERIFNDFADWKIQSLDYEQESTDVYCKLLTKRQLLLIQVPTRTVCEQLLQLHEPIKVTYFRFSQEMIQVPDHIFLKNAIGRCLRTQNNKAVGRSKSKRKMMTRLYPSMTFNDFDSPRAGGLKQTRSEHKMGTNLPGTDSFTVDAQEPASRQRVDSLQPSPTLDKEATDDHDTGSHSKPKVLPAALDPCCDECDQPADNNQQMPDSPSFGPDRTLLKQDRMKKLEFKSQSSEGLLTDGTKDEVDIQMQTESQFNSAAVEFHCDDVHDEVEFEVSQIDQKEQVRWYYDHLYHRSRHRERVEFESRVNQIARNFLAYLNDLLDKAFTEDVLFSFQQDLSKYKQHQELQKTTTELAHQSKIAPYEHLKLRQQDFQRAVGGMGYSSFRIDLNFAFLVYYQLLQGDAADPVLAETDHTLAGANTTKNASSQAQLKLLNSAQDFIFEETLRRNFNRCPVNPNFFIYCDNLQDDHSAKQAQLNKAAGTESHQTSSQNGINQEIFDDYQGNLKGTLDAFSDYEYNQRDQPKDQPSDFKEVYSSCRNMLFEVTSVIKDRTGRVIDRQPINSLSQVFERALAQPTLVEELVQKAMAQDQRNRERMQHLQQYVQHPLAAQVPLNPDESAAQVLNMSVDKIASPSQKLGTTGTNRLEDSHAGVDLIFRFYIVPRYVGLIQSKNVDFFRDEYDEILVNDDLQEDLLRVCRLFNLFDCFITEERVRFATPLFRKLKKSQIIRAIPYYFSKAQEESGRDLDESLEEPMEANDNRVFIYTEIQRRIIYGMLRRTYAIVAECVCEMLTMVQEQTLSSLAMVQKYLGQLIYNQRQEKELPLFLQDDVSRFTRPKLEEFLVRELLDNKVIKCAHFSRSFKQVLQIDPCPHEKQKDKKQATKRIDPCVINQMLYHTIYFVQGKATRVDTTSKADADRGDKSASEPQITFELPTEWDSVTDDLFKDKSKCVQFWCLFTVTRDLKLSYSYYLPRFKQGMGKSGINLCKVNVQSRLAQFAVSLRQRIRKLLFLTEIKGKKTLRLRDGNVSLQSTARKYLDKLEESKEPDHAVANSQTGTLIQSQVKQQNQVDANSNSMANQAPKEPVKKSKFGRGFERRVPKATKDEKLSEAAEMTNLLTQTHHSTAEQDSSTNFLQVSKKTSIVSDATPGLRTSSSNASQVTGALLTKESADRQTEQTPVRQLAQSEVKRMSTTNVAFSEARATEENRLALKKQQTMIDTSSPTEAPSASLKKTLQQSQTIGRPSPEQATAAQSSPLDSDSLEVFDELTTVITTTHQVSANEALAEIFSSFKEMRIFSETPMMFIERDKIINLIRMTNLGTKQLPGEQSVELTEKQERILIEVIGVDRPKRDFLVLMRQKMLNQIQEATIRAMAGKMVTTNFQMQQYEEDYLKNSPQKRFLMFPVNTTLGDKLALLAHLKQSLLRNKLFNEIKKMDTLQHHLTLVESSSANSSLLGQQHNSHDAEHIINTNHNQEDDPENFKVNFDENEEQLLFNYMVFARRHGEENILETRQRQMQQARETIAMQGQLGEFFGQVLVLLNFGFIERTTEQELDQIICSESQHAADAKLKEITKDVIEVNRRSMSKREDMTCSRGPECTSHQYSIPIVYVAGDTAADDGVEPTKHTFNKMPNTLQSDLVSSQQQIERKMFDKRASISTSSKDGHYWLKITAHIHGSLKEKVFIKTLTLLLNQAIADYMVDLHLKQCFSQDKRQIIALGQQIPASPLIPTEQLNQISAQTKPPLPQIPLLDRLLQTSAAVNSPLTHQLKLRLKSDSAHVFSQLALSLLQELQKAFMAAPDEADDDQRNISNSHVTLKKSFQVTRQLNMITPAQAESLCLLVVIQKLSNDTGDSVGAVVLKLPIGPSLSVDAIEKTLKKHLDPAQTLLRNIRAEVQFLVGSFQMALTSELVCGRDTVLEEHKEPMVGGSTAQEFEYEDLTIVPLVATEIYNSPAKIKDSAQRDESPGMTETQLTPAMKSSQTSHEQALTRQKQSKLNEFKKLASIDLAFTRSKAASSKKSVTFERNFIISVEIKQKNPGEPRSRQQVLLKTFNLSTAMRQRVIEGVSQAIKDGNEDFSKQSKLLAKCLGIDYALPQRVTPQIYESQADAMTQLLSPQQAMVEKSFARQPTHQTQRQKLKNSGVFAPMLRQALQQSAISPQQMNPQQTQLGRERKRKRKHRVESTNQVARDFDATQWFKCYFDKFLRKEQQLKSLMQMEVAAFAGQSQLAPQRAERSPSQLTPANYRRM